MSEAQREMTLDEVWANMVMTKIPDIHQANKEFTGLKNKLAKLKQLMLLTDPAVSDQEMNTLSAKQWSAFIDAFPDEK